MDQEIHADIEPFSISHKWRHIKTIDDYHCYSFSYYFTDQYLIDTDEAAVWINDKKNVIIVFTQNEELIDHIFHSLEIKSHVKSYPYEVGIHSFLLRDGKSIITGMYKQKFSNKVTTSLIRSDNERIKVIELLLDGDICGGEDRYIESSFSYS
jgi:hypothetical protein